MALDTDRIDDAVLALLYLGLHDEFRAWKGFDWDAMNRLHEKGMITDPVSKAKSVVSRTRDCAARKSCSRRCSRSSRSRKEQ
jgi:hypothetical protein